MDSAFNNSANSNIANAIVCTLHYYSLFQYPLKAEEIYGNLPVKSCLACLLVALDDLETTGIIYQNEGYFSVDKNVKEWVAKRKKANELAHIQKMQAVKVGRFLFKFPFVKYVGISGSLSKGYADAKSDFDFFIVTTDNRLWICRTLLHLFKKFTFLFGQQHKFCMNYFIDMHNLEIEEKNKFTAIELSSLIHVSGYDVSRQIKVANSWVHIYLPNEYVGFNSNTGIIHDDESLVKKLLEFTANHLFPSRINKILMALTDRKWRKKWAGKNYPMEDYDTAFKTTLHVSKNHPANHQKRILNMTSNFEEKYNQHI